MEPTDTPLKSEASQSEESSPSIQTVFLYFLGGSGAGLVTFAIFGGVWQVTHFWWVMATVTFSCGILAVVFRQSFSKMLSGLLDDLPWIS